MTKQFYIVISVPGSLVLFLFLSSCEYESKLMRVPFDFSRLFALLRSALASFLILTSCFSLGVFGLCLGVHVVQRKISTIVNKAIDRIKSFACTLANSSPPSSDVRPAKLRPTAIDTASLPEFTSQPTNQSHIHDDSTHGLLHPSSVQFFASFCTLSRT